MRGVVEKMKFMKKPFLLEVIRMPQATVIALLRKA
jgi:hypothetical protein